MAAFLRPQRPQRPRGVADPADAALAERPGTCVIWAADGTELAVWAEESPDGSRRLAFMVGGGRNGRDRPVFLSEREAQCWALAILSLFPLPPSASEPGS